MNLAGRPEHREIQERLRRALYDWRVRSGDLGLIPEPILENLGREHGNKVHVLRQPEHRDLVRRLIEVVEAGRRGDLGLLREALPSPRPSVRYWAATALGTSGLRDESERLLPLLEDPSAAVRFASALALGRLGRRGEPGRVLARELGNENVIVGMYAIRALEWIGDEAINVRDEIEAAKESPYEFTRRIAHRLLARLGR